MMLKTPFILICESHFDCSIYDRILNILINFKFCISGILNDLQNITNDKQNFPTLCRGIAE